MNNSKEKYLEEDEIDLKELISILWKYKLFILGLTFIVTFITYLFILFREVKPLYKGSLLIEIAQIKSEYGMRPVENIKNIKQILE